LQPCRLGDWKEFQARADNAIRLARDTLTDMLAAATRREAEQAELDRLRPRKRLASSVERDERMANEAAEKAKIEAERIAAEQAETARLAAEPNSDVFKPRRAVKPEEARLARRRNNGASRKKPPDKKRLAETAGGCTIGRRRPS